MKILVIYQYFGTPSGSWSTRFYELTRKWVQMGAKVSVLTAPYEKSDISGSGFLCKQHIEGVELIIINTADSNRKSKLYRAFNSIIFAITASYLALTKKYNVLIASSGPITVGLPLILSKVVRKKITIFEIRDLWPQGAIELGVIRNRFIQWIGQKFEALCYTSSDLIVPCSIGMEENIKNRFPGLRTLVIPNASDTELFTKKITVSELPDWANRPENTLMVYFGSLGLMDACDEIIKGFARVTDKVNIHIVFIGDGTERRALENLASELGVSKNVHFLGLLPKIELVGWLNVAVASFVVFKNYPVLSTSSPNKMFDSFAAGLPVIQNTTGWIRDLVDKSGCGINVEPEDENSMADAIAFMASVDKDQLFTMKSALHHLATHEFDRDQLAKKYLSAMLSLKHV
jgi:glycosyltransferase involved in cell wall biosynthesis